MSKISKVYTGAHGMHYNYLEIVFCYLFFVCLLFFVVVFGEGTTGTLMWTYKCAINGPRKIFLGF